MEMHSYLRELQQKNESSFWLEMSTFETTRTWVSLSLRAKNQTVAV